MKYFLIFLFSISLLNVSLAQIGEEETFYDTEVDICAECPKKESPKRKNIEGKYGFFTDSKWIIPPLYEQIDFVFSSYMVAKKEGKYGIIDSTNTEVVPFEYDNIKLLPRPIKDTSKDFFQLQKGKKYGIIHKNGNLILPVIYTHFKRVQDSLFAVGSVESGYGLIYRNGKKVTPFKFEEPLKILKNGIIRAKKGGKYGIINDRGKKLIGFKWNSITLNKSSFNVEKNGKFGLLDNEFRLRIKPIYDKIYSKNSSAFITTLDGKNGLITSSYEELIKPIYYRMSHIPPYYYSCTRKKVGGKRGVFNEKGELILDFAYSYFKEGPGSLFFAGKGRKYGVYNDRGMEIIPLTFSSVQTINENLVKVRKERSKKGAIMNAKGELITDFVYDEVYLSNGKIGATRDSNRGTLNPDGSENGDFVSYKEEMDEQSQEREAKKTKIFSLLKGEWLGISIIKGEKYITKFEFYGNNKGLRTFYYLKNEKKCSVSINLTLNIDLFSFREYTPVAYHLSTRDVETVCDLNAAPFPNEKLLYKMASLPVRDNKDEFSLFRFQKTEEGKNTDVSYEALQNIEILYNIERNFAAKIQAVDDYSMKSAMFYISPTTGNMNYFPTHGKFSFGKINHKTNGFYSFTPSEWTTKSEIKKVAIITDITYLSANGQQKRGDLEICRYSKDRKSVYAFREVKK